MVLCNDKYSPITSFHTVVGNETLYNFPLYSNQDPSLHSQNVVSLSSKSKNVIK